MDEHTVVRVEGLIGIAKLEISNLRKRKKIPRAVLESVTEIENALNAIEAEAHGLTPAQHERRTSGPYGLIAIDVLVLLELLRRYWQ